MGFLKDLARNEFGVGVSEDEIKAKFSNSNIPAMILESIGSRLLPASVDEDGNPVEAGDLYSFLNFDIKKNIVWVKFYTNAISVVSQSTRQVPVGLLKSETQYDEEESGYSFAASGIDDLPNPKYAKVLQSYICDELKDAFSSLYEIRESTYIGPIQENARFIDTLNTMRIKITLSESTKMSW